MKNKLKITDAINMSAHSFFVSLADQSAAIFIVAILLARDFQLRQIMLFFMITCGARVLISGMHFFLIVMRSLNLISLPLGSMAMVIFYIYFSETPPGKSLTVLQCILMSIAMSSYVMAYDAMAATVATRGNSLARTTAFHSLSLLGVAVYPILGGMMAQHNTQLVFFSAAFFMTIAAFFAYQISRTVRMRMQVVEIGLEKSSLAKLSFGRGFCEGSLVCCFGTVWQAVMFGVVDGSFPRLGYLFAVVGVVSTVTPLIMAWLIKIAGWRLSVSFYCAMGVNVSLLQFLFYKDLYGVLIVSLLGGVVGVAGNLLFYAKIYGAKGIEKSPAMYSALIEIGRGLGGSLACGIAACLLWLGLDHSYLLIGTSFFVIGQTILIWPIRDLQPFPPK